MGQEALKLGPQQLEQVGEYVRVHIREWMGDQDMLLRERIVRIEETQKTQIELIRKGFEQVDKRFEQVDKRFEQVEKRFEQTDRRINTIDRRFNLMFTLISGMFLTMLGGFVTLILQVA